MPDCCVKTLLTPIKMRTLIQLIVVSQRWYRTMDFYLDFLIITVNKRPSLINDLHLLNTPFHLIHQKFNRLPGRLFEDRLLYVDTFLYTNTPHGSTCFHSNWWTTHSWTNSLRQKKLWFAFFWFLVYMFHKSIQIWDLCTKAEKTKRRNNKTSGIYSCFIFD